MFKEKFWKLGDSQEFLGIPENFWEFPKISRNSQGDSLDFGKNKKKNVVALKSRKNVAAAAMVTFLFLFDEGSLKKSAPSVIEDPQMWENW